MFMMHVALPLSHGLIIIDRLFLRSFNAVFSFNVRLLWVFQRGVLIVPYSCSTRVKKPRCGCQRDEVSTLIFS